MTQTPEGNTSPAAAFELAALATAAVEDLEIHGVRPGTGQGTKGISTWAAASHGDEWQIYCPDTPLSESDRDKMLRAQAVLTRARLRGDIPFNVPVPRSIVNRRDGRSVFIFPALGGREATGDTFASETLFATSLATALGALHSVDPKRVEATGVPTQSAVDHHDQLESLLRSHWTAIPSDLRTRWNNALRDETLWQYRPCIIHGTLEPADVQVAGGGAVVAIKGFESIQVGDPAQDVGWLLYYADLAFLDRFETTYAQQVEHKDLHLMTRARLLAELETLRWYDAATKTSDRQWREEGRAALREMDQELRGTSLVDAPQEVVHIEFDAHEEPLLRLKETSQRDVSGAGEDKGVPTPTPQWLPDVHEEPLSPPTAATTVHPAPREYPHGSWD